MRDFAGEIRRAVDRVDDPDRSALGRRTSLGLLADEAVVGEGGMQAPGDQLFRLAVDLGQVILRTLEADLERGIEEAPAGDRARFPRDRLSREQPQLHGIGHGHRASLQKWL